MVYLERTKWLYSLRGDVTNTLWLNDNNVVCCIVIHKNVSINGKRYKRNTRRYKSNLVGNNKTIGYGTMSIKPGCCTTRYA